ncbi:MAG: hypothetical protein JST46_19225, partial [Bacteroidetes bacterium]|nr:hypothetical protein [Bacteroidota bacterium]
TTIAHPPFQYSWDTRSLPDGSYDLLATVSYQSGQVKTASTSVQVRNQLLTLTVPPDHLPYNEKGWIFLSSSNGSVIDIQELKNGNSITLFNHEYNEKTFMLSEAYLVGGLFLSLTSFESVPRGNWTLDPVQGDSPVLGSLQVSFDASTGTHPYFVSSSGDSKVFLDDGKSVSLNVATAPTRLFIREIYQAVNHYELITGLSANDQYAGKFSDLKTPLQAIQVTNLNGAQGAHIITYGFTTPNKFDEYYSLGVANLTGGNLVIEYPGSTFASYGSASTIRAANYRVDAFHPSKFYDITPLHAEVQFLDRGNNYVSVATSGDFDAYFIGWGYADKFSSFDWTWAGGGGQSEYIRLVALPDMIRTNGQVTFNPDQLQFYGVVQLAEYEVAKGYDSFLSYISAKGHSSPYQFGKAWKEQTFYKPGSTGGRSAAKDPPTIRDRFRR